MKSKMKIIINKYASIVHRVCGKFCARWVVFPFTLNLEQNWEPIQCRGVDTWPFVNVRFDYARFCTDQTETSIATYEQIFRRLYPCHGEAAIIRITHAEKSASLYMKRNETLLIMIAPFMQFLGIRRKENFHNEKTKKKIWQRSKPYINSMKQKRERSRKIE